MAHPSEVSVVIPAYNEGTAIGEVVSSLAAAANWREIIVVDDGSRDDTSARAASAGGIVVRHPYNKGNGAAVKSGIRRACGDYILIVDGDGQHSPADAERLVARLGEYDLVVGARSKATQASVCSVMLAASLLPLVSLFGQEGEKAWHLWVPALAQVTLMGRVLKGEVILAPDLLAPLGVAALGTLLCVAFVAQQLRGAALR